MKNPILTAEIIRHIGTSLGICQTSSGTGITCSRFRLAKTLEAEYESSRVISHPVFGAELSGEAVFKILCINISDTIQFEFILVTQLNELPLQVMLYSEDLSEVKFKIMDGSKVSAADLIHQASCLIGVEKIVSGIFTWAPLTNFEPLYAAALEICRN